MVQIPVVSVLESGHIRTLSMEVEPFGPSSTAIETRNMAHDPTIIEQLHRARQIAIAFLRRPYIRPVVVQPLEDKKVVLTAPEKLSFAGPSFGAAFLAGCLSVALDVPVREDRIISAGIGTELTRTSAGLAILLEPVRELGEKLAAACRERASRLYHYCPDEHRVIEFERQFWRGDVDRASLPIALPERLSLAVLAALALQPDLLIRRALSADGGEAFLVLLLAAAGELLNGEALLPGIGVALATLRQENRLPNGPSMEALQQDMGLPRLDIESLLLKIARRCLNTCVSDERRIEIVKAIISSDPERRLFAPIESAEDAGQANDDMSIWLADAKIASLQDIRAALEVLRACSQLAPSFEGYWSRAEKWILRILGSCFGQILQLAREADLEQARSLTTGLRDIDLAGAIARFYPDSIPRFLDMAIRFRKQIAVFGDAELGQRAEDLCDALVRRHVPAAFQAFDDGREPVLTLNFQLAEGGKRYWPKDLNPSLPRPPLSRYNNLDVLMEAPQHLCIQVPSPVLLFENALRQHRRYCLRRDVGMADDTLSRYPRNDAAMLKELYGGNVRVAFSVKPSTISAKASIKWRPDLTPWPPAIDSQLLAATMVENMGMCQPRRLLDVGCGTGYQGIVAAHCWPSLEELDFIDIDRLALAAAKKNVQEDAVAGKLNCRFLWKVFSKHLQYDVDTIICAPPYLPNRPLPISGIEVATNGTDLLEEVVMHAGAMASELWVAFSVIAWPEFERALHHSRHLYRCLQVLRREFVPFRIPWLEPVSPEDGGHGGLYTEAKKYYERVLIARGLLDMDGPASWPQYLEEHTPEVPADCAMQLQLRQEKDQLEDLLDLIKSDSRGYRFWHEVRVIRLIRK